jgi:hypothetical protein
MRVGIVRMYQMCLPFACFACCLAYMFTFRVFRLLSRLSAWRLCVRTSVFARVQACVSYAAPPVTVTHGSFSACYSTIAMVLRAVHALQAYSALQQACCGRKALGRGCRTECLVHSSSVVDCQPLHECQRPHICLRQTVGPHCSLQTACPTSTIVKESGLALTCRAL